MEEEKNQKIFDKTFFILIVLFLILFALICFFPKWFIHPASSSIFDFSETGQIGDTISGIMGPFIAILAAILTFIAFWVQYKANKQQTKQFKEQGKDTRIDRFESKLYELIKIHRDNLNEIELKDKTTGRDAFKLMYEEIKFSYYCVRDFFNTTLPKDNPLRNNEELIMDIAYRVFYLGVEVASDKLIIISLQDNFDKNFIDSLINYLDIYRIGYLQRKKKSVISSPTGGYLNLRNNYIPFDGHISKLGHYYRHLFHIIKYIAEQKKDLINEEIKCEYAKTVRAQLSDYEQLVLFYNINSILGSPWISEGYIKRFRMIKNMPVPLADFGILPLEKFKDEINYWAEKGKYFFEWDERKW